MLYGRNHCMGSLLSIVLVDYIIDILDATHARYVMLTHFSTLSFILSDAHHNSDHLPTSCSICIYI